jgi:hypothetical protein
MEAVQPVEGEEVVAVREQVVRVRMVVQVTRELVQREARAVAVAVQLQVTVQLAVTQARRPVQAAVVVVLVHPVTVLLEVTRQVQPVGREDTRIKQQEMAAVAVAGQALQRAAVLAQSERQVTEITVLRVVLQTVAPAVPRVRTAVAVAVAVVGMAVQAVVAAPVAQHLVRPVVEAEVAVMFPEAPVVVRAVTHQQLGIPSAVVPAAVEAEAAEQQVLRAVSVEMAARIRRTMRMAVVVGVVAVVAVVPLALLVVQIVRPAAAVRATLTESMADTAERAAAAGQQQGTGAMPELRFRGARVRAGVQEEAQVVKQAEPAEIPMCPVDQAEQVVVVVVRAAQAALRAAATVHPEERLALRALPDGSRRVRVWVEPAAAEAVAVDRAPDKMAAWARRRSPKTRAVVVVVREAQMPTAATGETSANLVQKVDQAVVARAALLRAKQDLMVAQLVLADQ